MTRKRFWSLFVTAFVLLVAVIGAVGWSFQAADRARGWVEHTYEVIIAAENLLASLNGAEAAQRAFIIAGAESLLGPFEAARRAVPDRVEELGRLVADHGEQQARVAMLAPLVSDRLEHLEAVLAVYLDVGTEAARAEMYGRGSFELMTEIRARLGQLIATEEALLQSRMAATDRQTRTVGRLAAVAAATALALLVAAVLLLDTEIRRRERAEAGMEAAMEARMLSQDRLRHSEHMAAIGKLAAGVAHDFNNLLQVIIGQAEHARYTLDPFVRRACIDATLIAAERAATLTEQLLSFGRRQFLRPVRLELNAAVAETVELLSRTLGDHVQVTFVRAASPVFVEADRTQLDNVLINFALNARDAMPRGGTLRVGVETTERSAAGELGAGRYALVEVRDDGTGIRPEHLDRVFEPFFTTKDVGKGAGLGLSMAVGYARQSGGDVEIASTLGVGTTVTLLLPAVAAPAELPPVPRLPTRPATAAAPPLRILLVEDDPQVRRVGERMLTDLGHVVYVAEDAAHALQVLAGDAELDLLLTDVLMPGGMDGVDLARRAGELRPDLRVMFASAYAREGDVDAADLRPLLRKPFRAAELRAAIGECWVEPAVERCEN